MMREIQRSNASIAWIKHRILVCKLSIAGGICTLTAGGLAIFAGGQAKILATAAMAYYVFVVAPSVDEFLKQQNPFRIGRW